MQENCITRNFNANSVICRCIISWCGCGDLLKLCLQGAKNPYYSKHKSLNCNNIKLLLGFVYEILTKTDFMFYRPWTECIVTYDFHWIIVMKMKVLRTEGLFKTSIHTQTL